MAKHHEFGGLGRLATRQQHQPETKRHNPRSSPNPTAHPKPQVSTAATSNEAAYGVVTILWPAAIDSRFLGTIVDPTYVTTRPGTRNFFYRSGDTDPAVVVADEATKDTASLSETTYLIPEATGLTTRIGVPTLRVIGQYDNVICNPRPCTQSRLARLSPALFPAGVTVYVQPGAGHDVALEFNNNDGFNAQLAWLESRFPTG